MSTSAYDILFEPVRIGPVTAPNRFYAVPHATGHGWNQPSGAIALRGMKAEGGWGTVAVQITEISADTDMASHPMERIWDDGDIPRHAAQVEAIKCHGSLAAIELGHGGMRARNMTSGLPVLGPSGLPVLRPEVPAQAKAMDLADIRAFRQAHKNAAKRAVRAGYDIIYVYAAHDISLLSNFLSINTNKRRDAYGGSFTNRLRLLREVLEDTLEVAAGKRAVAIRFGVAEPGRKNGLSHEGEGRDVVEELAELPDLWDVNISGWSRDSASARFSDEGFQLQYTDFVKSVTSKPVVGVGRFTSADVMVSLVRNKRLDLIGAARPSIADPFLPSKIKQGRLQDIRECIGCNICVSMDSYGLPIRCTQNPTISEEWKSGWHPESSIITARSKSSAPDCQNSYLIIGAGPAGLECAVTLLRAGHKVTVADAATVAGGRVTHEAQLPGLASWFRVRDYRLYQLSQSADADLYLSSRMSAADVEEFNADGVVLATGASWRRDGVGSSNFEVLEFGNKPVFTPDDIMTGTALPETGSVVAVYDDDHFYMASALAEMLVARGHTVIYITPLPMIASWTDFTLDQDRIIERLNSLGVRLLPNVALHGVAEFINTLDSMPVALEYDALVFVGARVPDDSLYLELMTRGTSVYQAGDCVTPGLIYNAVLSGHTVARQILTAGTATPLHRRDQIYV